MYCFIIFIFVYRVVGAPGHVKNVVDGLNTRNKLMLKLETEDLLNPELISDDPDIFKFMQVHENEED